MTGIGLLILFVLLCVSGLRRRARERDVIGLAWTVQQVQDAPLDISELVHREPALYRRSQP